MNLRIRKCKKCGKVFKVRWDTSPQRFCSRLCAREETNLKISLGNLGKKKSLGARKNMSKAKKGRPWTAKMRKAIMPALQRGEAHHAWKAKNVSYGALHTWLYRWIKKEGICTLCGAKGFTEWSLKVGFKYDRKADNFEELCRSCHRRRDFGAKNRDPSMRVKLDSHLPT